VIEHRQDSCAGRPIPKTLHPDLPHPSRCRQGETCLSPNARANAGWSRATGIPDASSSTAGSRLRAARREDRCSETSLTRLAGSPGTGSHRRCGATACTGQLTRFDGNRAAGANRSAQNSSACATQYRFRPRVIGRPTRGWVPAPSHVPLTALLITNGDAGLCIRMRWRSSLTSADSVDDRVQSGLIFAHRAG
jgi:hypothetical protein